MSAEPAPDRAIFSFEWRRRRALRRAWLNVFVAGLLFGLFVALGYWPALQVPDAAPWLRLAQTVAVVVAAMFTVRAVFNLGRAMLRRTQVAHFSREGFAWQVDETVHRYRWEKLARYRTGARTWRIFGIPVRRFGSHRLTMNDKRTFTLHHGITSPKKFDTAVGPVISEALGVKMADTLRSGQAVRLHPGLMVSKAGVIVFKGRKKIGIKWAQADVKVAGGQLVIGTAGKNGRFKTVRRYPAHRVDNLGGFLDLAEVMLTAHQPNRRTVV